MKSALASYALDKLKDDGIQPMEWVCEFLGKGKISTFRRPTSMKDLYI